MSIKKSKVIINYLVGIVLLLLLSIAVMAQDKKKRVYPMPGDTIADHTFADLLNYPKPTVKISDFRGKWLILDFWGYTCSGCILSFPHMDSLSQQFKGKNIQFIMVGATKSSLKDDAMKVKQYERLTKDIYKRQDMLHHLKFTVAFDSLLYLKLNVGSLPHILVVNPDGIIKAKTDHIDSTQVAELLADRFPLFERKFSLDEPKGEDFYNKRIPLLTNNGYRVNGGRDTDYIYRSILVPYDKGLMPYHSGRDFIGKNQALIDFSKPIRLELYGYSLRQLYHLAYFGRTEWNLQNNPEAFDVDDMRIFNETKKTQLGHILVSNIHIALVCRRQILLLRLCGHYKKI